MAAAAARAEQLDSIADNLANVETPGFKASHPAFESFLPPKAGKSSDKVAAAAVGTGTDLSRGLVKTSGNPLDIVPQGSSFLTVQTPSGMAYTRNGRLTVSPEGLLTTSGLPLLGVSGNPIEIPIGATPLVNEQGSVMVDQVEIDRLALADLQGNVVHKGQSLYASGPGGTVVPSQGGVEVGQIEMANATALDATVQMIGAQRQFETAMQAIQTYRRLDDQVMNVGKAR
ncbi:MAG TPA: flagellar hook basal-body protein [Polyangia bacterium]|jgi:flagellar basal-body rod protein FlgF